MRFKKYPKLRTCSTIFICAGALFAAPASYALNVYLSNWQAAYPASNSDNASCQLCHGSNTSTLNAYGADLCLANINFASIEGVDSDGEGSSNFTEIDANAQPGWSTDGPNPLYDTGNNCDVMLAADSTVPSNVPQPYDPVAGSDPIADAAGPYETVLGNSITFDGTGSSDDGSIDEYFWEFGDGSTAIGAVVTHTYGDVGVYDVLLTVTDNDSNTAQDQTTATILEPAALDLDIAAFRVSKNIRLGKSIKIVLVITNEGTIDEMGTARVTGVQNGSIVFDETIDVFDSVGNGRTTFDLGPYTPDATGVIEWTATVDDGDPDVDEASATSNVK